jgi:putative serine protease PepD
MRLTKTFVPLAAAAVIGGGVGAVATDALHNESQASVVAAAATTTSSTQPVSNTTALSPHDVYEKAKDSVAYITSQITQSSGGPFGQTATARRFRRG